MPRGSGNYWVPGGLDSSQPSVARDSEDRHGISHICANHLTLSAYTSGATLSLTHLYPTPGQTQNDCSEQFPYPPHWQQYILYAAPPPDLGYYSVGYHLCPHNSAKFIPRFLQISPVSDYSSGQCATQPSGVADFEYPPSESNFSHHPATHDTTGCLTTTDSQHQDPEPSCYLPNDGFLGYYGIATEQPIMPMLPFPSSSGSSELSSALVETSLAEPRPRNRAFITISSLSVPPRPTPEHGRCGGTVGHSPVKAEYGASTSGQAFLPMTPPDNPSLAGVHSPYIMEEDQEQNVGTTSMRRTSTPLHGHGSLRHQCTHNFCMVKDPAAYTGCLSIPCPHSCTPGGCTTPPSPSSLFSDSGTPTSRVNMMDGPPTSSSLLMTTMEPDPKTGQGMCISIPCPHEGRHSYSSGGCTALPSSLSLPSDTGPPTSSENLMNPTTSSSSVNLVDNPQTLSSLLMPTMELNPRGGQGVLILPLTKGSTRCKPGNAAIACLFCREHKIACGVPPNGSAGMTCE